MKFCILMFLSLSLFAQEVELPFLGDARPTRQIRIRQTEAASLTPSGKDGEIVLAPDASKMTRFAATELQSLLKEKLGRTLPVVNAPTPGAVSFILGVNEFSRKAGIDDRKLCRDAFIIKTVGRKIYILGHDDPNFDEFEAVKKISGWQFNYEKGTLFGVYDFLERFADARFFFAGPGTLIPKGQLRIPEIDIYDRPDYEARQVQIYEGKHFLPENSVYERNLDYLRMRFSTQYVPCCHGLGNLGYWQRFGKTHPEYFFLDSSGKRVTDKRSDVWMPHYCYTSGVKEELYQDAKSCLLNEPASKRGILAGNGKIGWDPTAQQPGKVFCAMPGDSFMRCQCEKCKPFMKDNQTISDFYWGFVFDIAERLIKEKVPGIVTNMSYPPYQHIPRGRKMPSNVYVMVATTGAWSERYPETQKKDTGQIREWVDYGGHKVWLWNYSNKYADKAFPGIPNTTPQSIGKYYKEMAPLIHGAFLESETDYYQFNLPQYYVFGKVCWDNKTDVDALLSDYYQRLFGPAAPVMRQFFERIEYLWTHKLLKDPVMTDLGPSNITASNHEAWTVVYSKAERASLKAMFDQAEKLASGDPDSLGRVKLFRKLFLDVILRYGEQYDRQIDSIPRFGTDAASLPSGENVTVNGRLDEPIWRQEGIYLQNLDGKNTDRSRVVLTADAKNLYIAFDFTEPLMAKVRAPKRSSSDKNIWKDNGIEIFLNPDCSRTNYYQIILSSSGSIMTLRHEKHGINRKTSAWDPALQFKVTSGENSWGGELAIPLSDLGLRKAEKIVVNVNRHQVRENMEDNYYSWTPFLNRNLVAIFHDLDNFGTIYFDRRPQENLVKDSIFSAPRGKTPNVFGQWIHHQVLPAGVKVSHDFNTFVAGPSSLRMESEGNSIAVRQNLPTLKPDTKYRVSFFVRLENIQKKGRFSGVMLNIMDDKNLWFPTTALMGTIPWTYQEGVFTSGPNTNDAKHRSYLLLYLMGASGTAWFDNIKLEEIK